jgi:hypothetical protein
VAAGWSRLETTGSPRAPQFHVELHTVFAVEINRQDVSLHSLATFSTLVLIARHQVAQVGRESHGPWKLL